MEYYDVIIIGAGIAGCGLAYNLKRIGYKGSVLIIDKEGIGSNIGYVYRNTFEETIKKYNLPYYHKFNGLKMGTSKGIILKIPVTFYLINYQKTCKYLFDKAYKNYKKEKSIAIKNNFLKTDKAKYEFRYLIDCSGGKLFARKYFKKSLPKRYWIGNVKVFKYTRKDKDNCFYFLSEKNGFVEDLYFVKNITINGWWQYAKDPLEKIKPPKDPFSKQFIKNDTKIIANNHVVLPAEPVLPLIYKNIAFLGDSFGNATPATGEGIRPILNSSEILANAIKKGSLLQYEKEWKEKYLDDYQKAVASKIDMKNRLKIIYLLKDYPEIFLKLVKNESVNLPIEIKKKFPKNLLLKQISYYLFLRFKRIFYNKF